MQTSNYFLLSFSSYDDFCLPTEEGLKLLDILSKAELYKKDYIHASGELLPVNPDSLKVKFLDKASYDRAKQSTKENNDSRESDKAV